MLAVPLRSALVAVSLSLAFHANSPTAVAAPQVRFDFARAVVARDASSAELTSMVSGAQPRSDEKIIQFTLPLSVQLLSGDPSEITVLQVEIYDCDRRLSVVSFSPTTRLESQLSADVEWSKTSESNHTLGVSLGGESPLVLGDVVAHVTPSANAGVGGREVITERQKRLPPKQVVVASGTIQERHGVYFHLKPTPQTTLEGVHELTVAMAAPSRWRGDSLRVKVSALGKEKFLWISKEKTLAQEATSIAVYIEGDAAARTAAERYLRQ